MQDVSIDLETFGLKQNSVIIAIGACLFDPGTGAIGETFYTNVEARSGINSGFELETETLYWWCKQSSEAGEKLTNPSPVDINTALLQLNHFLASVVKDNTLLRIWSHSQDRAWLDNAYDKCNLRPKYHYRSPKDISTLHFLVGDVDMGDFDGIRHYALDDAINQARWISKMLQKF